ncbi:hypothetical protein [Citrobacter braakii]|uniref:hypothetical protein n=1 Tax=Citrobacter braakii TaxID=57706 RepID=UPI00388517A5
MFDLAHFRELTLTSHQADRILAIIRSQDDIGIYLRTHLLIEQSLEAWIICASGNRNFFSGFGENINMDFAVKAQLAMNYCMSPELNKFIRKFNNFRNKRSHQIDNSDITSSEIDSLTGLIERGYPDSLVPVRDFRLGVYEGENRVVRFSESSTSLRDKLIMLFAMFSMRVHYEAECLSTSQS